MKKKDLKNYKVDETSKRGVRYVGVYYTTDMPKEARRKSGLAQIAAGILEVLLIFIAVAMNCMGTRTFYVVIPLECILFCAMYYVIGAHAFYRSDDRMEQKTFDKAIDNPIQIVTVAIILNLISLIGQIILIIRKAALITGYRDYILLVLIIVLLGLHLMMWSHQRKLHNKTKPVK